MKNLFHTPKKVALDVLLLLLLLPSGALRRCRVSSSSSSSSPLPLFLSSPGGDFPPPLSPPPLSVLNIYLIKIKVKPLPSLGETGEERGGEGRGRKEGEKKR